MARGPEEAQLRRIVHGEVERQLAERFGPATGYKAALERIARLDERSDDVDTVLRVAIATAQNALNGWNA